MGRMSFVWHRLLLLVPVAFGVTVIVFFMVHLIPGDPARTILGVHATPRAVALLHHQWHLDQPLLNQYLLFLDGMVQGNLGQWLVTASTVSSRIGRDLPPTLWLLGYGAVLAIVISVPLATVAASRQDGVRDHLVRVVPLLGL